VLSVIGYNSNISTDGGTANTIKIKLSDSLTAAGTWTADAVGVLELNSSGAAISIGNDAVAQPVNIGTGAATRVVTIGSASSASQTIIQAGTAGVSLSAAGLVSMTPGTASFAGTAVTLNKRVGVATFTGLTTAAAASEALAITNSFVTAGSAIFVSCSNLGVNDAQMTVTRVKPEAGAFTVTVTNNGAAALDGDIIISFWVIN
jgi:hypothetical protein